MDEKEEFRNEFAAIAISHGVAPRYADSYYELIFEIAIGLMSRGESPLLLGIAGAQGTGKSTFAKMLAIILERVFEKTTLVMSLDDFYLTRAERTRLAETVHPLLRVRGVPGTHDIGLLLSVINDLKKGSKTEVPTFNKATDDRASMLPVMGEVLDIMILEGWCWGAQPASPADLDKPVNALEAELDGDGRWRRYVNQQLGQGGYQQVFAEADVNFFLAAPNFATVVEWRWQQEQDLAARSSGEAIMDRDEVQEFVMYYERITRRMLVDLPERANLTLYLDETHQIIRPPRDTGSSGT